jgi:hypothetical protein
MADEYFTDKRKASTAQGAAYGASTGAMIGTAIAPGVGTAIGAGVGLVGGGLTGMFMGGQTDYEKMRDEQIAELKRRQEMGLLGLTDEERRNLEAQMIDPIRAQQREAYYRGQAAMSGMDAGTAARMNIGQQQMMAEAAQPARVEIERADLQKARYEEEKLLALQAQESAEISQLYTNALNAMLQGGMVSAQAAVQVGQIEAMKGQQAAMMRAAGLDPTSYGMSPSTTGNATNTVNSLGGFTGLNQ